MSSPPEKRANLVVQLGLAALSGSAIGALLSKFQSVHELQASNPRLYDMLIAAGVVAAHEATEAQAPQYQAPTHAMQPPGFLP